MPVLIRGIFSGGGRNITLDDCTNISVTSRSDGVEIKWKDPEDIIFNGQVTARWTGTKLVRKEGSYPKNDKDGVLVLDSKVRDQHSTVAFNDTGVKVDVTYHYCLFPYTEKAVTMSDNNRFTGKRLLFDPILKNNTWEMIAIASEQGLASSLWQIGDEIDLTLSGAFNETVTLQIWDFNHFEKTDGSGQAGICFGMKHLMKNKKQINSSDTNSGGWNKCQMRTSVMENILNSIPVELRNKIKEVKTSANKGGYAPSPQPCVDKVFIPGFQELGWSGNYDGDIQVKFPIFTDNRSRIKKMNNGSGSDSLWWTRSPSYINTGYDFRTVDDGGNWGLGNANSNFGVCFCFNV